MPQASPVLSSAAVGCRAAPSPFVCTWKAGSRAAWVHVAGALDITTTPQLRQTLREAQLQARLLMLDLRELTFIDRPAVHVILDADGTARRKGGRLMLARGPAQVDRMFTLTGACDQVVIFDLDPAEPSSALMVSPEGVPAHKRHRRPQAMFRRSPGRSPQPCSRLREVL